MAGLMRKQHGRKDKNKTPVYVVEAMNKIMDVEPAAC
ncbi:hypothetical protein COLO4_17841 [Corchorus olitorius]|uniref:Uncharacterized protein n=1 Tax=Corchorus olitorius TaxID=93759 RepID=A0A1R3JBI6_9ROSI|nr:hypothetical protein COLO4_17841 [Corchorus olitorius]